MSGHLHPKNWFVSSYLHCEACLLLTIQKEDGLTQWCMADLYVSEPHNPWVIRSGPWPQMCSRPSVLSLTFSNKCLGGEGYTLCVSFAHRVPTVVLKYHNIQCLLVLYKTVCLDCLQSHVLSHWTIRIPLYRSPFCRQRTGSRLPHCNLVEFWRSLQRN